MGAAQLQKSSSDTIKVFRPTSSLYRDIRFAKEAKAYNVKLRTGEKDYAKDLLPASGNQIVNLDILSHVFSLLRCVDKQCKGRIRFYEQLLEDGLQKFLLIKCDYCNLVVAQFPASLPIGVPADSCVNNKSIRVKGQSDLNLRSLLAVHTTSHSLDDFRLTCCLLDLKVPSSYISKRLMKTSWTQHRV